MPQKKFLIIDDDADDRKWLIETIRKIVPLPDFIEAKNGKEALEKLNEGARPDVVFMDINMPLMNGIQFLNALSASKKLTGIPVIVLSTSSNPEVIRDVKELGVERYVIKPNTEKGLFKEVFIALTALINPRNHS